MSGSDRERPRGLVEGSGTSGSKTLIDVNETEYLDNRLVAEADLPKWTSVPSRYSFSARQEVNHSTCTEVRKVSPHTKVWRFGPYPTYRAGLRG